MNSIIVNNRQMAYLPTNFYGNGGQMENHLSMINRQLKINY